MGCANGGAKKEEVITHPMGAASSSSGPPGSSSSSGGPAPGPFAGGREAGKSTAGPGYEPLTAADLPTNIPPFFLDILTDLLKHERELGGVKGDKKKLQIERKVKARIFGTLTRISSTSS